MDFGLGKLSEALGGGKKAEGPALIAALNPALKQGGVYVCPPPKPET